MSVVRSASLRGYAQLVADLGGDPEAFARKVSLPVAALYSEDEYVPSVAEAEAMQHAATALNCPDFGLRLSEFQDISGLGPLALALRHSPTLGDALDVANRYLHIHSPGSQMLLEDLDGSVQSLRYCWPLDEPRFTQAHENALLNLHRVILLLAGGPYGLRGIDLGHRALSAPERYEALFGGVRIRTGQPVTRLRVPRALAATPVAEADQSLRDIATFYLAQVSAPAGKVTTVRVQVILEAILGTGQVGLNAVAQRLDIPARTLQRRLAEEERTLSDILDTVRRQRADRLLGTEMAMVDVAASIDLDQATFSRYARRWWGTTPTARRRHPHPS